VKVGHLKKALNKVKVKYKTRKSESGTLEKGFQESESGVTKQRK